MKKTVVLAAALLALGAPPAAAQNAVRHELALQLLEAMHVPDQLQASVNASVAAQLQAPQMRGMEGVLRDFFARYITWNALKDPYADLYARQFTEDELRAMTAFYRSPAGQKLARSTPQLMREGAQLGERVVRAHQAELQQMIVDRLRPPPQQEKHP